MSPLPFIALEASHCQPACPASLLPWVIANACIALPCAPFIALARSVWELSACCSVCGILADRGMLNFN